MCHKSKPPYNQWKLEEVALEKVDEDIASFCGRLILDRATMPPYTPRKALDRKSFPCHDACFYIFVKNRSVSSATQARAPATLPSSSSIESIEDRLPVPVTPALIDKIRSILIRQAKTRKQKPHGMQRNKKRRKI